MTVLLFPHDGWIVATAAWSAASKKRGSVIVCYQWGADWISVASSATGIARVSFKIDMAEFVRRVGAGGVVDLTAFVE